MDNKLEKYSEAFYYLVAAGCAIATTLIACEMCGIKLGDRFRAWKRETEWKLKQEQFNFFYEQIWPALRKAKDARQSDE